MSGRVISFAAGILTIAVLVVCLILIWTVYGQDPNDKVFIKVVWTLSAVASCVFLFPMFKCLLTGLSKAPINKVSPYTQWKTFRSAMSSRGDTTRTIAVGPKSANTSSPKPVAPSNEVMTINPGELDKLDDLFPVDLN